MLHPLFVFQIWSNSTIRLTRSYKPFSVLNNKFFSTLFSGFYRNICVVIVLTALWSREEHNGWPEGSLTPQRDQNVNNILQHPESERENPDNCLAGLDWVTS